MQSALTTARAKAPMPHSPSPQGLLGLDLQGDHHWYRHGGAAHPGFWVISSYAIMPPRFSRAVCDDFGNLVGVSS